MDKLPQDNVDISNMKQSHTRLVGVGMWDIIRNERAFVFHFVGKYLVVLRRGGECFFSPFVLMCEFYFRSKEFLYRRLLIFRCLFE